MRLFILVSAALILTACSKKNSGQDQKGPRAELLVNKKWQQYAESEKAADGTVYGDTYSQFGTYLKDDFFVFQTSSRFTRYAGADWGPGVSSEIVYAGKWSLTNSDQYLVLDHDNPASSPPPMKITGLTDRELHVEYDVYEADQEFAGTVYKKYRTIP